MSLFKSFILASSVAAFSVQAANSLDDIPEVSPEMLCQDIPLITEDDEKNCAAQAFAQLDRLMNQLDDHFTQEFVAELMADQSTEAIVMKSFIHRYNGLCHQNVALIAFQAFDTDDMAQYFESMAQCGKSIASISDAYGFEYDAIYNQQFTERLDYISNILQAEPA